MNVSHRLSIGNRLSIVRPARRLSVASALPRLQPLDGEEHLACMQTIPTPHHAGSLACPGATQSTNSHAHSHTPPSSEEYSKWHTFDTYANWLIPGSVLLGRYPFVEPSRCTTREQGEMQLDKILRVGGVDTFVSLQEELPPQDQMKLAGKNGFLPYRATAELIQAALNGPPPMEGLHALRTPELDKFLPPKKKKQAPPPTSDEAPVSRKRLTFLHHPIVDLGVPDASPESLGALLSDLERRLEAGEKLYIHCWGGRGRAGTVGACLLGKAYGLSADEALARVQKAFDTRVDENRRSPETDAQHQFVRDYLGSLVRA